jgi:hypothetical protein
MQMIEEIALNGNDNKRVESRENNTQKTSKKQGEDKRQIAQPLALCLALISC